MRTEVVNNLADEAIYQIQYYKKLNLTHKKLKIFLILFSNLFICLIAFLVYYYLKF